eukprot:2027776-Heterocapsa_arctica.AAC.1
MALLQNIGQKKSTILIYWNMVLRSTSKLDKESRTDKWSSTTSRRTSIFRLISERRSSRSHTHEQI